jgi:hypothetical protein
VGPIFPLQSQFAPSGRMVFRIARYILLTSPHWSFLFCSPPSLLSLSVFSLFSFPLSSSSRRLFVALCPLSRRIQIHTLNHPSPPNPTPPPALSHPRGLGCFAEMVSTLANPSDSGGRRLRFRLLPVGFPWLSLPSNVPWLLNLHHVSKNCSPAHVIRPHFLLGVFSS